MFIARNKNGQFVWFDKNIIQIPVKNLGEKFWFWTVVPANEFWCQYYKRIDSDEILEYKGKILDDKLVPEELKNMTFDSEPVEVTIIFNIKK